MEETKRRKIMENIPTELPVIPTMDVVVFPHMVVPLLVLDKQIIKGIEKTLEESKKVLLLATKEQNEDFQGPIGIQDLYQTGTVATIMRVMKLPEGGVKILVQGQCRATVEEIIPENNILSVRFTPKPFDEETDSSEVEARIKNIIAVIDSMSTSGRVFGPDAQVILSQVKNPEKIADFVLSHLNIKVGVAQKLLEEESVTKLLDGIYAELSKEIEIAKVQEKIQQNARESINQSQREYYLREQLKAIQKELGDDADTEIAEIKKKLEQIEFPKEAKEEVDRQFKRLEKTPPDSMEYTVIRNYLDWMIALPWGKHTEDNLDISHAKAVLDEDHFGLEQIKDRILDFLSVRAMSKNCQTPILCFAGPPGVGKTSLGESIAKCINKNFSRISVGGIHDESEIRGHRRTYVGAMPGRFIQAIRKAESSNPLIMIDEIDKIGKDHRGDPSSALLEVLDPAQNGTFYDNYLGVNFDLSKVLFITTANDLSTIPGPLRDRMEIIELSGYTVNEKMEISRRHLIPKAIKNYGLSDYKVEITSDVIEEVATKYTREAGVRQLERLFQKLCAKYARLLLEENKNIKFTPQNLFDYLGTPRIPSHNTSHKHKIGVSNGLAWTPVGGEVLQVEAVLMPGRGQLILTGQLGSVMKESAQAAVTYARSKATKFDIPKEVFNDYDLHIHLPAGAIPKDGPSAGITMLSAVLSALTARPINGSYAMTGELSLQGEVLPIGGLKEKILAAKQEGVSHVIVPKLNELDLKGLGDISNDINIIMVEDAQEVLDKVLMPK